MNKEKKATDKILPFFIAWLLSIALFILLIGMTEPSSSYTDFENTILLGSMLIGSISYLVALITAIKQKLTYYIWALGAGFILFFYALFQMAN